MGFLFGIPKKLINRINEIEIDTHYYDNDVVPSSQNLFTYTVDKENELATITGLADTSIVSAVIPYKIHYDQTSEKLIATVVALSDNCFVNNTTLKSITIPNTIKTIPTNCFKDCSALATVNIPKSVNIIKANAFNNCDSLNSMYIPFTVTSIEEGAFLDCDNLNIICYKYSVAEKYAEEHNIPYSLISYTVDKEITKGSENLVTSGTLFKRFTEVVKMITDHINNKSNPHDSSTFKDAKLTGITSINNGTLTNLNTRTETVDNEEIIIVNDNSLINKKYLDEQIDKVHNPDVGSGYQTIVDNQLNTSSKTIPGAINEVNAKINTIAGTLEGDTWNTVDLNKKYPLSWTFLNKPYCYTDDGLSVDYRINNKRILNNSNVFDIYVPIKCNYTCSTTELSEISGYPIDYLLVNYYYTGADGRDLDTVTGINNANWPTSLKSTVGYRHGNEISYNDIVLIKWGGDNMGGGSANASTRYYESIYFNIKAIQEQLPNEDIEVILYGTWFSEKGNSQIHIQLITYTSDSVPTITLNSNKTITLTGATESYTQDDMTCSVVTKKGTPSEYKTSYTPVFKIVFKKNSNNSNYRTISVIPLS